MDAQFFSGSNVVYYFIFLANLLSIYINSLFTLRPKRRHRIFRSASAETEDENEYKSSKNHTIHTPTVYVFFYLYYRTVVNVLYNIHAYSYQYIDIRLVIYTEAFQFSIFLSSSIAQKCRTWEIPILYILFTQLSNIRNLAKKEWVVNLCRREVRVSCMQSSLFSIYNAYKLQFTIVYLSLFAFHLNPTWFSRLVY